MNLRQELEKHQEALKRDYFSTLTSTHALKADTLQGNTARAYKYGKCYVEYKPTSIFKHWLHNHYFNNTETLKLLKEGKDFQKIHASAIEGLEKFWRKTEPKATGLQFYHFAKLIDLLFKCVPRWDELTSERREWFFNNANVPADKYALLILQEFNPKYSKIKPSMNFVTSKNHYDEIQRDIREMIAPFPPLLFDLYAWDYRRKKQLEKKERFELERANSR